MESGYPLMLINEGNGVGFNAAVDGDSWRDADLRQPKRPSGRHTTFGGSRSAYWDNVKALLILLVVLGHFLTPLHRTDGTAAPLYYWIYSFHMPAFVFVSGFFSKSFVRKPKTSKLAGFLLLYLAIKGLQWLLKTVWAGEPTAFRLFYTSGTSWYMFCMFIWYCVIPYVSKIRPVLSLSVAILVGALVGTDSAVSLFLGTSMFAAFFPFFLVGYHARDDWRDMMKPWMRGMAALFLAGSLLFFYTHMSLLNRYMFIAFGSSPYAKHSLSVLSGCVLYCSWILISSLMTLSLLLVTPKEKMCFTYVGSRTLAIYVFHVLLRNVLRHYGFFSHIGHGFSAILVCVLFSIATCFVFSGRRLSAFVNKAFAMHLGDE